MFKNSIKKLLKEYNIKPSKKLGQNFLIDKIVLKKFIKSANLQSDDIVLEIGPGIGTITKELTQKVKKVIAIEKDPVINKILKEALKDFSNIKIISKDILKYQPRIKNYKVVGNLPFYLTSPVIRKFLENKNPPQEMVLIVQKEVAQRICAKPPKINFLAVVVQFYSKPKIISYVSKKSFWPSPEVDAAIIKISQIRINLPKINRELFFEITSAGFSHPRKQLVNNLSKKLKLNKGQTKDWLLKNNIKPFQRAESLTVNDWIRLAEYFNY